MKQYQLDLGMEPTIWEKLGFGDEEHTCSWFSDEQYESWREEIRRNNYDAWSRCWRDSLAILESKEKHPQATIELAEAVFNVMCSSSMVPIVETQFEAQFAETNLTNRHMM